MCKQCIENNYMKRFVDLNQRLILLGFFDNKVRCCRVHELHYRSPTVQLMNLAIRFIRYFGSFITMRMLLLIYFVIASFWNNYHTVEGKFGITENEIRNSTPAFLPCLNLCRWGESPSETGCSKPPSLGTCFEGHVDPASEFTAPNSLMLTERLLDSDEQWKVIHLSWEKSNPVVENAELNYTPAYMVEVNNGSSDSPFNDIWIPVGMVCSNTWQSEVEVDDDCGELQFRVVALGQCFQRVSNYSLFAPMNGLRFPPQLSNPFLRHLNREPGNNDFEIGVTWNLKWNKWAVEIDHYQLVLTNWSCAQPGFMIPSYTKLSRPFYNLDKTIAYATLKIHYSNIGCRLNFELRAVSTCGTKTTLQIPIDLVECRENITLIPSEMRKHCRVPPVDMKTLLVGKLPRFGGGGGGTDYYSKGVKKNLYFVTWEPSSLDFENVHYTVAWTNSNYSCNTAMDVIDYSVVSGNTTCAIVDCEHCSDTIWFQVMAEGYGNVNQWQCPNQWSCFENGHSVSHTQRSSYLEQISRSCPFVYSPFPDNITIDPPNDNEIPLILNRCNRKPSEVDVDTTTTTLSTETLPTTISATTTTNIDEKVNNDSNDIGMEIWLPITIFSILSISTFAVFTFCIRRTKRRNSATLTVDKLREVISEVSGSSTNVFRTPSG